MAKKTPTRKKAVKRKTAPKKTQSSSAMTFNHAMVYSRDVAASMAFYVDLLGFRLVEDYRGGDRVVYARLKAPQGDGTIAIHLLEPGKEFHPGAVRLYFEVRPLEKFCKQLESRGARFSQMPKKMPWGWMHAYLDDPDGHEVSLYWAGSLRMKKTPPMKSGPPRKATSA